MYLKWAEQTITDFSDSNINSLYNQGYLFTRVGKGVMNQTRSIRIDLKKFKLTSENRRILKKTEDIGLRTYDLPIEDYDWSIGKMAKDFYETKFGKGIFSANKTKELLTSNQSNFNKFFIYKNKTDIAGYCIALETNKIIHYAYPFYLLSPISYLLNPNTGLGMMLKAVIYAKESGKKYIYLGSAQRPTDTYKLQFEGLEWFDGKGWKTDIDELKKIL
ncbi:MAG: hypothetical protein HZC26_02145 [Candidatus Magasanikbacteria bacterium]|nr:hypothetical protein [Candidatus Magasanikbacteria bacterium]